MSKEIGNWKPGLQRGVIVTDVEVQGQTPETTAYYGGFLICESVPTTLIQRRIIASVRACKDLILHDLEQEEGGYWVRTARNLETQNQLLTARLEQVLPYLHKMIADGNGDTAIPVSVVINRINEALGRGEATEPDGPDPCDMARDYMEGVMEGDAPTPYDP